MKKYIAIVACVMFHGLAFAAGTGTAEHWFSRGNAAYQSQNYDSAVSCYEKIESVGMRNAAVYYNLGNAYFRQKKIGMAILYYEKARQLAPGDPDILANIAYANRQTADRISEPEKGLLESAMLRLHTLFPLSIQLWAVWILLAIISILFSAGLYASRNVRLWFIYTGSLCIAVAIALGVSAGTKISAAENSRHAIVLVKSADARNEPDGTTVLFTAHEGARFRVHQESSGWFLVSLPNGVKGWVEKSSLGLI